MNWCGIGELFEREQERLEKIFQTFPERFIRLIFVVLREGTPIFDNWVLD